MTERTCFNVCNDRRYISASRTFTIGESIQPNFGKHLKTLGFAGNEVILPETPEAIGQVAA